MGSDEIKDEIINKIYYDKSGGMEVSLTLINKQEQKIQQYQSNTLLNGLIVTYKRRTR
jgi:hypothetical protein